MSSSNADPDPLIGSVLADRYRVDEVLGEGGMGKVYRAEHVLMKKRLALKVLHRELSNVPDIVARFEREARAAANIEHANVAAATDFGKLPSGDVYLALEYVQGRSLRDVIALEAPMVPARALRISRQVASALSSAHALSIVHRDLKPENVMLVDKGGDPDFVKVLDFGIAKVPLDTTSEDRDRPITKISMILGTPEYMAPEQAMSDAVDGRADVFALGVMLYEMLCGVRPFVKTREEGILAQQLRRGPPAIVERAPHSHVPPQLEAMVMRLLSIKRDGRPAAAEVVGILDALLVQPLGQSGQMFTKIRGSMDSGGSWPDTGSSPGPLEVAAAAGLAPGSIPDPRWGSAPDIRLGLGSMPELPRDALASSSGPLPGLGSVLDATAAPWPSSIPEHHPVDPELAAATGEPAADAARLLGPAPAAPTAAPAEPNAGRIAAWLGRPCPRQLFELRDWSRTMVSRIVPYWHVVLRFIDTKRQRLPGPLRDVPAPAYAAAAATLAGAIVITLLVVGIGWINSSGADGTANASNTGAPSAQVPEPAVSPVTGPSTEDIEKAKHGERPTDALAALAERHPKDAAVRVELAKAYRLQKEYAKAVETLTTALALDPTLNVDGEIATLLWTTAQHQDSRDQSFALLEGPMGAKGADIVYDLVASKQVSAAVKKRAEQFLKSERFDSQASAALQVALGLRRAGGCHTIHGLLLRAKEDGDERALRYLRRYEATRGCGRRQSQDCFPCLRGDSRLRDAIAAIEQRTKG